MTGTNYPETHGASEVMMELESGLARGVTDLKNGLATGSRSLGIPLEMVCIL